MMKKVLVLVAAIATLMTQPLMAAGTHLQPIQTAVPLHGNKAVDQMFRHTEQKTVHYKQPTVTIYGTQKLPTTFSQLRTYTSGNAGSSKGSAVVSSSYNSGYSNGYNSSYSSAVVSGSLRRPATVSSANLSFTSKVNTPVLRRVINWDDPKIVDGKTMYYDDEVEAYVEVDEDTQELIIGQVAEIGGEQKRWDGTEWVEYNPAEVDNPIGSTPWLMLLLLCLITVRSKIGIDDYKK